MLSQSPDQDFYMRLYLSLFIVCGISEGSGETAHLRRLACTFSVYIHAKQSLYMMRLKYGDDTNYCHLFFPP